MYAQVQKVLRPILTKSRTAPISALSQYTTRSYETLALTKPAPYVTQVEMNRPENLNAMNKAFWRYSSNFHLTYLFQLVVLDKMVCLLMSRDRQTAEKPKCDLPLLVYPEVRYLFVLTPKEFKN